MSGNTTKLGQGAFAIDWTNPLVRAQGGLKSLSLFPVGAKDLVTGITATRNASGSAVTNIVGPGGPGVALTATLGEGVDIAPAGYQLFPSGTDRTTICVIRRKRDTTSRQSSLFVTSEPGATTSTNQVSALCPYNDGSIYWQFGFFATNRLTVAGQSWDTGLDTFVFVAGPNKGLEVWRRGTKIGSNSSLISTISSNSMTDPFSIGSNASFASTYSITSDSEEVYYLAVFNAEWSDSQCQAWFANPYQIVRRSGLTFSRFETALPIPFLTFDPTTLSNSYDIVLTKAQTGGDIWLTSQAAWPPQAKLVDVYMASTALVSGADIRLTFGPSVAGTIYTQSFSVITESSSAAFSQQIGRLLQNTAGSAAARQFAVAYSKIVTEGSAASLSRPAAFLRSFAPTSGSAYTFAQQKSFPRTFSATEGSSSTKTQTVNFPRTVAEGSTATRQSAVTVAKSVAASSAYTLVRAVAKVIAITAASVANLLKGSAYTRSAAVTEASAATRQFATNVVRAVTGGSAATLAFISSRLKNAAVTGNTSVTLARGASMIQAISSPSAAALIKNLALLRLVAVSSSAVFIKGSAYFRTAAATISSAASLARASSRSLALSVTNAATATLARLVSRLMALGYTSGATPALARIVNLIRAVTEGSVVSRVFATPKTFAASVASAVSRTSGASNFKTLSVSSATTATLAKLRVVIKALAYSANSVATLARQAALSQTLAVAVALTPALRRSIAHAAATIAGVAGQLLRALPETLRTQAPTSVIGSAATGHGARILQGTLVGFGHSLSKFARLLSNPRIYVEVFSPNALLGGTHVVIKFAKTTLATAYHALINNIRVKF